jgi:hypothetical protein
LANNSEVASCELTQFENVDLWDKIVMLFNSTCRIEDIAFKCQDYQCKGVIYVVRPADGTRGLAVVQG